MLIFKIGNKRIKLSSRDRRSVSNKEVLRWLNTVLAVCECTSFVKSWQEKGSSSQAETWQVKHILMKDFD